MKNIIALLFIIASANIYAQVDLPDVTLMDLNGKQVSLATISKNKTVVISLWATWCVPCIKELDAIATSYNKQKKDIDFELIAVSVDDTRSTRRVKPFVTGKGWDYQILLDTNNQLRSSLGVTAIPYTLIVKDGKIKYRHTSFTAGSEAELFEKFKKIKKS